MYWNYRSICLMPYVFCVDNAIMPIECIAPISNEETFIEFHVVLIVADTSQGNISRD